jgi:hypothetical protein
MRDVPIPPERVQDSWGKNVRGFGREPRWIALAASCNRQPERPAPLFGTHSRCGCAAPGWAGGGSARPARQDGLRRTRR